MSKSEDLELHTVTETVQGSYEVVSQDTKEQNSSHQEKCDDSQPHEHSHGHRGMSRKQENFIVAFTVAMPVNVLILEHFWLNEPLKDNEFDYRFSLCLIYFLFTMSMVAYYNAIKIKNQVPDKQPPEVDHFYLPEVYKNNKRCDTACNKWKPSRSHHCRQCGNCSIRMDHHCPWTVNCVGARNHKAFYLFCIYMGLGSSHYCYRTVYFFITESDKGTLWDLPSLFYPYWFVSSFILFAFTMMLVSLMIFHTCAALTNVTTLENMAGTSVNCCTNNMNDQFFNRTTNLFDRGIFANYTSFLGNSLFLFWFPNKVIPDKDGTEFPMNPPLTLGEMLRTSGKMDMLVSEEYYEDKRKIMEDFSHKAEIELKDKNLQISGKIFQHFKKYESASSLVTPVNE